MRARHLAGLAVVCLAAGLPAAKGQTPSRPALMDAHPVPRDGTYTAADDAEFVLDHRGNNVRVRFSGSDEVFYLTSEAAPLGARVLKYDTGDPALRVTGWGGVTLYTPQAKTGVPAEYSDVIHGVDPPPIASQDVKRFAAGLAHQLNSGGDLIIGFAADWGVLADSPELRGLACDAMRNTAYALQDAATGANRNMLAGHVHVIRIIEGDHVFALLRGGVLTIMVAPKLGPAGRPSSLKISRALASGL